MVGRGGGAGHDELQKARKVVQALMRHKHSKTLFNQPVDPDKLGLPDYFEIVKQPQDFGSILTRLHSTLEKGSKVTSYSTAAEVFQEVSLVFNNCKAYNRRDQDSVTRQAAEEVQGIFEDKWAAAGLARPNNTSPSASESAPAQASPQSSEGPEDDRSLVQQYSLPGEPSFSSGLTSSCGKLGKWGVCPAVRLYTSHSAVQALARKHD